MKLFTAVCIMAMGLSLSPLKALGTTCTPDLFDQSPKAPSLNDLLKALTIIAQHANIQVDIGKGRLDACIYSLRTEVTGISNTLYPLLNRVSAHSPLDWRDESDSTLGQLLDENLYHDLASHMDRYRDFPEVVWALSFMRQLIASSDDVKEFFRRELTPMQVDRILRQFKQISRSQPAAFVKRADVADPLDLQQLAKIKSKLSSKTSPLLLGLSSEVY